MNRLLWVLQIVFGLYFIGVGVAHFVVPDGLPAQMEWMYDLSDTLHTVSGIAEILGGLGLILPAVTRIRPELVSYAAFGLALVMVGAVVWHLGRGEPVQIALNVVNVAMLGFIGYGRMRLHPIPARTG
ncbi:MAG: DoxX family protein [Acidimicrobiia bacterium]